MPYKRKLQVVALSSDGFPSLAISSRSYKYLHYIGRKTALMSPPLPSPQALSSGRWGKQSLLRPLLEFRCANWEGGFDKNAVSSRVYYQWFMWTCRTEFQTSPSDYFNCAEMDIYKISFFGVRVFLGVRVEGRIKSQQHTSTSRWVESLARCAYGHVDCCYLYINSLRPCDACMRQQNRQSLVQIIACRLFGTKPLSEPMLYHCPFDTWEKNFYQILLENGAFSFNCIWKCLENVGHVVSGSVC